jgi:alanyl-tRNA synthetase
VAIFYDKSFRQSTLAIPKNAAFGIIMDRTNFYAEAGGQEYDTGNIVIDGATGADIAEFEVSSVQVFSGYVLHIGRLKSGTFELGSQVTCSYDEVGLFIVRRVRANVI